MAVGWCSDCQRALPMGVDCDGGGLCPYCDGNNISCKIPDNAINDVI